MSPIGLVMSGGGARGAYEVGVLRYIFGELVRRRKQRPNLAVIAGTSVGAVNGAYLASVAHDLEYGTAKLEAMWSALELEHVVRFGFRQVATLPRVLLGGAEPTGLFDVSPLRALASRELDWTRLRANIDSGLLHALTITTTHIMTGRPVVFVDRAPGIPFPSRLEAQAVVRESPIRIEHVLASAAIPLVFPPVAIDGFLHCDGGLRLNTPMAPAIHLGADRLLVIGVSTPSSLGVPAIAPGVSPGAPFLLGKVLNAFLLDHLNNDLMVLDHMNSLLRHGLAACGEKFVAEVTKGAVVHGADPRRIVDVCCVRPSLDIGRVAAEHLRIHRLRFGSLLGRSLLHMLDVGEGADADLASYLLFDGVFARRLIDLGHRDAKTQSDELEAFLFEPEPRAA